MLVQVTYQGGVFRPLAPVDIPEGQVLELELSFAKKTGGNAEGDLTQALKSAGLLSSAPEYDSMLVRPSESERWALGLSVAIQGRPVELTASTIL